MWYLKSPISLEIRISCLLLFQIFLVKKKFKKNFKKCPRRIKKSSVAAERHSNKSKLKIASCSSIRNTKNATLFQQNAERNVVGNPRCDCPQHDVTTATHVSSILFFKRSIQPYTTKWVLWNIPVTETSYLIIIKIQKPKSYLLICVSESIPLLRPSRVCNRH